MTLKVIGAGYGRTGTLSLKTALEELGFGPCYHMEDVVKRPSRMLTWHKIVNGAAPDWDALFAGFEATVDWPACNYYQALMTAYPQAKVVLSVRDPERWYDSVYHTIYAVTQIKGATRIPLVGEHIHFVNDLVWDGVFNGRFEDRAYAIQIFNEHIEKVKAAVPPEKLLVFNVQQGWEPLCEFLGMPVPERPFPHVNDRQVMENRLRNIRFVAQWGPIMTMVAALLGVSLLYRFGRNKRVYHDKI